MDHIGPKQNWSIYLVGEYIRLNIYNVHFILYNIINDSSILFSW